MSTTTCDSCGITFTRKDNLKKHNLRQHGSQVSLGEGTSRVTHNEGKALNCPFCTSFTTFASRQVLGAHIEAAHSELLVFQKTSAIGDRVCIFRKNLAAEQASLVDFCNSKTTVNDIFRLIKSELVRRTVFRISIVISANYEIPDLSEENSTKSVDDDTFSLRSKGLTVNQFESNKSIRKKIEELLKGAVSREEDLLTRGSGWRFDSLQACDILLYDVCYVPCKTRKAKTTYPN